MMIALTATVHASPYLDRSNDNRPCSSTLTGTSISWSPFARGIRMILILLVHVWLADAPEIPGVLVIYTSIHKGLPSRDAPSG